MTIIDDFYGKIASNAALTGTARQKPVHRGVPGTSRKRQFLFNKIMFDKLHFNYKTYNLVTNTRTYFFRNARITIVNSVSTLLVTQSVTQLAQLLAQLVAQTVAQLVTQVEGVPGSCRSRQFLNKLICF